MQFMKLNIKSFLPHVLPLTLLLLLFTQDIDAKSKYYGYLGVGIDELIETDKEDLDVEFGVLVTDVKANSPAEKAGIVEDDVIQYFKGEKITSTKKLVEAVRECEPNSKAQITLVRDGAKKDVYAMLGKKRQRITQKMYWHDNEDHDFVFHTGSSRGFLGVQLQNLNEDLAPYFKVKADEGALIMSVVEDSPAEEAKLKSGDVIVKLDNNKVSKSSDVSEYISDREEGDEVNVTVIRKGKKVTLKATLDAHKGPKKMMIFKSPHGEEVIDIDIDIPHIEIHKDKLKMQEMKLKEMEEHLEGMEDKIIKKEIIIEETDNI